MIYDRLKNPGSNLRHLLYKANDKTTAPRRLVKTQWVTVGLDLLFDYCLHIIFQKLHSSKSHFSETPQEKYDHVIFFATQKS